MHEARKKELEPPKTRCKSSLGKCPAGKAKGNISADCCSSEEDNDTSVSTKVCGIVTFWPDFVLCGKNCSMSDCYSYKHRVTRFSSPGSPPAEVVFRLVVFGQIWDMRFSEWQYSFCPEIVLWCECDNWIFLGG